MAWEIEFTQEFETWWNSLTVTEQEKVDATVRLLEELGPALGNPHTSAIKGSKHALRELRIQVEGRPFRVLYAFDPRRAAILLIGGDKTGDDRWYEVNIPQAERIYEEHLAELKQEKEGSENGKDQEV